jgi:hypothetical protein
MTISMTRQNHIRIKQAQMRCSACLDSIRFRIVLLGAQESPRPKSGAILIGFPVWAEVPAFDLSLFGEGGVASALAKTPSGVDASLARPCQPDVTKCVPGRRRLLTPTSPCPTSFVTDTTKLDGTSALRTVPGQLTFPLDPTVDTPTKQHVPKEYDRQCKQLEHDVNLLSHTYVPVPTLSTYRVVFLLLSLCLADRAWLRFAT